MFILRRTYVREMLISKRRIPTVINEAIQTQEGGNACMDMQNILCTKHRAFLFILFKLSFNNAPNTITVFYKWLL